MCEGDAEESVEVPFGDGTSVFLRRKNRKPDQHNRYKNSLYRNGCIVYCAYCFRAVPKDAATIEHVYPVWRGGKNRRENYVIACYKCNQAKSRDDRIHTHYGENRNRETEEDRIKKRLNGFYDCWSRG